MNKENYKEYLRLKREAKYLVKYATMRVRNWTGYDLGDDLDFLDAVVSILGSKKEYEKFSSYKMGSIVRKRLEVACY